MNKHCEEIFLLIEAERFKQARTNVGKLLSQLPSSTYLKILDQYVKFRQSPGKYSYENNLAPLLEMTATKANDASSLELLHNFLVELKSPVSPLIPYERAITKYPSSDLCYLWFERSLADLDFEYMNRSSFQLPRYVSDSRGVKIWNAVVALSWFKTDPDAFKNKDRHLYLQLSYQLLSNLKPPINEQEVVIFSQLCELLGEQHSAEIVEEIFKFMDKDRGSLDLYVKDLLVRNLKLLGKYDQLFDTCVRLLKQFDDILLLKHLIYAGFKLNKPMNEISGLFTNTRNGSLAYLELSVVYEGKVSDSALRHYLSRFHDKPCCPVDISHYMKYINQDMLTSIFAENKSGLQHDANLVKILGPTYANQCMELFIKYQSTLRAKPDTDYSSCSFLVLQVVNDLLDPKLMTLSKVLTAVSILESYQSEDPFNYDTRIWLIVLYQYLGIAPLAHKHYMALNIKNIQVDVVDHIIYTRYSTLYPNKNHDYLRKKLSGSESAVYQSLHGIPDMIKVAFVKGSFTKIPGMISLYDQLRRSLMRWMNIAESHKVLRLFNDKKSSHLKTLHKELLKLGDGKFGDWADNRDFSLVTNFVGNVESKNDVITEYMNINNDYVTSQICQTLMLECITVGGRNTLVDRILSKTTLNMETHTVYEKWAYDIICEIYSHMEEVRVKEITDMLDGMPSFSNERNWKLVHGYLTHLMTLKTLDSLKKVKDQSLKSLIKKKLQYLRSQSKSYFEAYISDLKEAEVDQELLSKFSYKTVVPHIIDTVTDIAKIVSNL
ncbi:HHR083Wp [Eremothecium sinecaudum]|uniref:HHR083Wp n=1 Tax=Eremothecium sinecaudum TaxID=45286 RepID=A0A0X8HWK8_9SACH|nr:HHR083Wp [Eremothecium sinecaudum]AMD22852.1 HHR083Wp [Eremothecium sinecaudum]